MTVGYDRSWVAPHECRIATLACGFADGYARDNSSRGRVGIRGGNFTVAGKVCMDQLMVYLGPTAAEEEEEAGEAWGLATSGGGGGGVGGGLAGLSAAEVASLRQRAFKQSGNLAKLEAKIEQAELEAAELDASMLQWGSDAGKVLELMAAKEKVDARVAELYASWEETEELVALFPDL
mmetsp:Transcript_47027/g.106508  ORF Transcript_47027/g.106508 Transcript_47027/m.106508 type:complete len:179 (+) Transcript_47027:1542-2078(+)